MALSVTWLTRLRQKVRPSAVTFILLGALLGWVGWQLSQLWFDRPLPASAIQAQQLRVNTAKYETLQKNLEDYHHPVSPAAIKTNLFPSGS